MNSIEQLLWSYRTIYQENIISNFVFKRIKSRTCIEDLSNEIFYEIFDYFDGCHLYDAFSNLNTRFQNLLINPHLLLKINLCNNHQIILEHTCMNIINPNKYHIISLQLSNAIAIKQFLRFIVIDSFFTHLQSIIINGIQVKVLQLFLLRLTSLPNLYSLDIAVIGHLESFDFIYQSIFRLPFLRFNKLSYGPWRVIVTLPLAKYEQFSLIEYLNIDVEIDLNELISILSYTPQLRHLTCQHLFNTSLTFGQENMFVLPNLTCIQMNQCRLSFQEFEIFIKMISSQLYTLCFTTFDSIEYLDAKRWQNLIEIYIPHLRTFKFSYEERIPNNFQVNLYHQQINQFKSSFWLKQQWNFELEIHASPTGHNRIIYLIHPYRKKLYFPTSTIQDIELKAINGCDFDRYPSLLKNINCLFQIVLITCLDIDLCYSSVDLLIKFLNQLPNLHSLNISHLPVEISIEETSNFDLVSNSNKIKTVNLEEMIVFEQVQFLIDLCPCIEDFHVKFTNNFNYQIFKRFILMKINNEKNLPLRLLCFHVSTVDEKMIQNLQTMLDLERILSNYSLKRILDRIYFQWK